MNIPHRTNLFHKYSFILLGCFLLGSSLHCSEEATETKPPTTKEIIDEFSEINITRIQDGINTVSDDRVLREEKKACLIAEKWLKDVIIFKGILNVGAYKGIPKEGYRTIRPPKNGKKVGYYTLYHLLLNYFYYGNINTTDNNKNKEQIPSKKTLLDAIENDKSNGNNVVYTAQTLKHMFAALWHHFGSSEEKNNYAFQTNLVLGEIENNKSVAIFKEIIGNGLYKKWLDDSLSKRKQKIKDEIVEHVGKYANPASFFGLSEYTQCKEKIKDEKYLKDLDKSYEEVKQIKSKTAEELMRDMTKVYHNNKQVEKEIFQRYKIVWRYEQLLKCYRNVWNKVQSTHTEVWNNISTINSATVYSSSSDSSSSDSSSSDSSSSEVSSTDTLSSNYFISDLDTSTSSNKKPSKASYFVDKNDDLTAPIDKKATDLTYQEDTSMNLNPEDNTNSPSYASLGLLTGITLLGSSASSAVGTSVMMQNKNQKFSRKGKRKK